MWLLCSSNLSWNYNSEIHTVAVRTWPTRVLMIVFLNLLSLCSVTLICALIISAEVSGLRGLPEIGTVANPMAGLVPPWFRGPVGDTGADPPPPPPTADILLVGDFFSIFIPRARFIRLVGDITTTGPPPIRPLGEPVPAPSPSCCWCWWLE
jgi:hypothetical protein